MQTIAAKSTCLISLALCLAVLTGCARTVQSDEPQPVAERGDFGTVYHGQTIEDPYQWMEDMDAPRTQSWVKRQDDYTRAMLRRHASRRAIKSLLETLGEAESAAMPRLAGKGLFFARFKPGTGMQRVMTAEEAGAEPKVVIDADEVAEGKRLLAYFSSPKGDLLAWAEAPRGSRWVTIRVRQVETGRDLEDKLTGINLGLSSLSWRPDGAGFFYDRLEAPPEGQELDFELRPLGIYYHKIGTAQEEDKLFYRHPRHGDLAFTHRVTRDGRDLLLLAQEGDLRETFLSPAGGTQARPRSLFQVDSTLSFLGRYQGRLLFMTAHQAPLGRVVAVNPEQPAPPHWETVVPESGDTLVWAVLHGDHLLLNLRRDAAPRLELVSLGQGRSANRRRAVELPALGLMTLAADPGGESDPLVRITGLVDPGSIYQIDLEQGALKPLVEAKTAHDPSDYRTRQVFYTSKDGTRVPMFLVHRKDYRPDGKSPVFMYGYGAGKWAALPWYQDHLVAWMEMGGVYALPNIRGGGEYGEEWYRDGIKHNKQNAIDDFIAAGRWLIDNGYTTPQRLVANGGSASGPLAGAALVQHPELWGAVVIEWPALDMLRFDQYPGGRFWTWANGDPQVEEDFRHLKAWSPYHNLKEDACFPPTFILLGEKDESTIPAHGYKFQAELQRVQSCANPVLMRMIWEGAHYQYGPTPETSLEARTDLLTFLAMVLDLQAES